MDFEEDGESDSEEDDELMLEARIWNAGRGGWGACFYFLQD